MEPDKKFLINLAAFSVRAKKETYASGGLAEKIKEADGSTSLIYEENDWRYHDNYFGGEPFGGREVVFYKNKPVFFMCYYGKVFNHVDNFTPVYLFLQKALSKVSEENPFRGPAHFYSDEIEDSSEVDDSSTKIRFHYFSKTDGDIKKFSGQECIARNNDEIYEANFFGGLINLRD